MGTRVEPLIKTRYWAETQSLTAFWGKHESLGICVRELNTLTGETYLNMNMNVAPAIPALCGEPVATYVIYASQTLWQGRIQDSQKGGAQIHCSEHDNCVRSTRSGMRSMPNLGGSGGMPPQKILKI